MAILSRFLIKRRYWDLRVINLRKEFELFKYFYETVNSQPCGCV